MYKPFQYLIASLSLVACGTLAAQEPDQSPEPLAWLSGCWQHLDGSTQEVWTDSYGKLMFGYAVTERDGQLVAFEDMRIEPRATHTVYVVHVNGTEGISFTETDRTEMSITFENADHDFPQRIAYQRDGIKLTATISLSDGQNAIPIRMQLCEAA